jgi:hypothetical protein
MCAEIYEKQHKKSAESIFPYLLPRDATVRKQDCFYNTPTYSKHCLYSILQPG